MRQNADFLSICTILISLLGLFISICSFITSRKSAKAGERSAAAAENSLKTSERSASAAEQSLHTHIDIFKRQGVIDLHNAWSSVHQINPSNPNASDVIKALQALELTAAFWNHGILDKIILHQVFWDDYYRNTYEMLANSSQLIPEFHKTSRDMLSKAVTKAYGDIKNADLASIIQTDVSMSQRTVKPN